MLNSTKVKAMKDEFIYGAMPTTAGQFIANYSLAFVHTYIKQYI